MDDTTLTKFPTFYPSTNLERLDNFRDQIWLIEQEMERKLNADNSHGCKNGQMNEK